MNFNKFTLQKLQFSKNKVIAKGIKMQKIEGGVFNKCILATVPEMISGAREVGNSFTFKNQSGFRTQTFVQLFGQKTTQKGTGHYQRQL